MTLHIDLIICAGRENVYPCLRHEACGFEISAHRQSDYISLCFLSVLDENIVTIKLIIVVIVCLDL